mgnify:CR=1 FL=1
MKKLCFLLTAALAAVMPAPAQKGAITPDMLDGMRKAYQPTPAEKALRNALNATDINTLATDAATTSTTISSTRSTSRASPTSRARVAAGCSPV